MDVREISWAEVYERLRKAPKGLLYGIPRGGAIVAGLTGRATDDPSKAAAIVDDIKDSGATLARWEAQFNKPTWVLVDKNGDNRWVRFPWEERDPSADLKDTVVRQLELIGENPLREGLRETPARVIRALQEFTGGYQLDYKAILATTFEEKYDEMVVVRDIDFYSLCEHHMLPFIGKASIGYIPNGRVVGVSKLARLVDCFARRLQIQERLTQQIARAIEEVLEPRGVAVVMKAKHMCMSLRGIKNEGAILSTSCLLGFLREKPEARAEFLNLLA